jgi:predicted metal-binding membrane protein
MKKPAKIALAVASIWPFIWIILFVAVMFGMMFLFSSPAKSGGREQGMPLAIMLFFAAHFLTMFLMFGLTAFYIVYLFRTDRIAQDKKALWAVVLFLGNIIAFPVFWYLYIWKEPEALGGAPPNVG